MAAITCPHCGTENDKLNVLCINCGKPVYPVSNAERGQRLTLILDPIFAVLYLVAIPFFGQAIQSATSSTHEPSMLGSLPVAGSPLFGIIIGAFIAVAVLKVLYVVNHFTLKLPAIVVVRKVLIFIESVTLIQFVLALYFYIPGVRFTEREKEVASTVLFFLGITVLVVGLIGYLAARNFTFVLLAVGGFFVSSIGIAWVLPQLGLKPKPVTDGKKQSKQQS